MTSILNPDVVRYDGPLMNSGDANPDVIRYGGPMMNSGGTDWSGEVAAALNDFHTRPTAANLSRVHRAVNAYQINVTILDEPFLDEIRALTATESESNGTGVTAGMFRRDGVHLAGMTLPYAGLAAVALAVWLAMKGRRK